MEPGQRVITAASWHSPNGNEEQQMVVEKEKSQEKEEELFIEIGLASEANESTPLLSKQRGAQRPTLHPSTSSSSSSSATSSSIHIEECLNCRILAFLSMIITSLGLATYLLWRQSHFPDKGYSLELIEHDIWSNIPLRSPILNADNVRNVFITHTASEECYENCVELLRSLQRFRLDELPYNFLITSNGQAFEARGWHYESDFAQQIPEAISLTMEALIRESHKRHRLQMAYNLFALRNTTRHTHDAELMREQLEFSFNYRGEWLIK
ncbi:peptidoglycan-recognition protein LD isoform X2 [Drosophila tropicalis]|uniref:peptidoglycan-recognition protein LD isoform X2 n=1 Tax=Drosophila tropicalis TaxID=46794 RepID=UPI0035AB96A8